MRLALTVLPGAAQLPVDVVVELDDQAAVHVLRDALRRSLPGDHGDGCTLWAHDRALVLDRPVGASGLCDGDVVGLGSPAPARADRRPGRALHVVGGPDTGVALTLPVGPTDVGRDGPLRLSDPDVSRRHLQVTVDPDDGDVQVQDTGSTNGTRVDGVDLLGPAVLEPGHLLRLGDTALALAAPGTQVADLRPDGAGGLDVNRPPRLLPPPHEVTIVLPEEPTVEESRGFPVLAMAAPVVLGVVMALVLGPRFLLLALLSPVMLASSWWSDRRRGRGSYARRRRDYDAALARAHLDLEQARRDEARLRRSEHPDAVTVAQTATGPGPRLWERRADDPDHLWLRLGLAELPSRVVLRQPRSRPDTGAEQPQVPDVPVSLPLAEVGVLGLAGPPERTRAVARWLVTQVAVLHRPRDVVLVLLTSRRAEADWSWLRWLPHARPGSGPAVRIGNDSATTAHRVAELVALVRARTDSPPGAVWARVVVVLDGARALRQLPGVASLLRDGPPVGVLSVCLDEQERLLPEECQATVVVAGSRARVQRTGQTPVADVLLDQVGPEWAERVARALTPLRDIADDGEDGPAGLPSSCRLLDLLGMPDPTAEAVAARWAGAATGSTGGRGAGGRAGRPDSALALLGAGTDGPIVVDLVRDGPHALVAGTTGAGKSELLQGVVASLALTHRPEEMTFVLVDYKGGSAFAGCAGLPHVVGLVTDLDAHLVQRALASLRAELTRRERVLAAAGARDLTELRRGGGRLARLVVVVDEFASLVRELPDFVAGLVGIAQRGRSLGLHLVLATQRPTGVVSPEIRANTDLRIALRVTDAGESSDVLDVADAATIDRATPGRGYVRLAQGTLAPFQAGRVSGRRPGQGPREGPPPHVARLGWAQLGHPTPGRPDPVGVLEQEDTDLTALVDAVAAAARLVGATPPASPWLPPLPATLLLDDLAGPPGPAGPGLSPVPYGLVDEPGAQRQRTACLDLATDGHLFAVGASRSGRSQLLRTLAGSVARTHSVRDVHLYGLDCAGGALLALAELPHCGAVVTRSEPERAGRLLARLTAELSRRQALLSGAGHGSITEARSAGTRLPHVVLLVDGWEGFTGSLGEGDGGVLLDQVMLLLREGAAAGVHVVATGDRSLLLGRLGTTTENKIAFRLADPGDLGLLGLSAREVPVDPPPGRAVRAGDGGSTQVALLDPDPAGQAQARALARLATRCAVRDADLPAPDRPFHMEVLPRTVALAGALQAAGRRGPLEVLLGIGGDDLTPITHDLGRSGPVLLVAGPSRSGRSTALVCVARSLLAAGSEVVVVAPRPSPLRELIGARGVRAVFTSSGLTADELTAALMSEGPVAVLLDDAELLRDCGARDELRILVAGVPGRALVLAGAAEELAAGFTGWLPEARRTRQGLLLSPQGLSDGDLVGLRLPRSVVGRPVQPGRGLVHLGDGRSTALQVPTG